MPETESDIPPENHEPRQTRTRPGRTLEVWLGIARQTLREPILRFAGHLALLAVIALGVWAARVGLDTLPADAARTVDTSTELLQATVTVASIQELEDLPPFSGGPLIIEGVTRIADVHTIFPTRPRLEVIKYVVQKGDHLFGISEKFGIKPETLLWGNYDVLEDNPHALKEGQELNIPPVDGTMYTWHAGDGLSGVADFFGVTPQDIVDWPGNNLAPDIDFENPSIEPGTLLMIPGGSRELVTWSAPRITRSNPAVAKILGPGACGSHESDDIPLKDRLSTDHVDLAQVGVKGLPTIPMIEHDYEAISPIVPSRIYDHTGVRGVDGMTGRTTDINGRMDNRIIVIA